MNNNDYIKTVLYDEHEKLEAKIIPFSGYLMPVNYSLGISSEYDAVRNDIGIFDVSHMGKIMIEGKKSEDFLNFVTTNNILKINNNSAQYSALCNNHGGTIDDIIVYKKNSESFFLIVNASNINKNFNWLNKNNIYNVKIKNLSNDNSLIALQGPNSRKKINEVFNLNLSDLKFYTFLSMKLYNENIIISRTGYTGELGYEFIGNHKIIKKIWEILIDNNVSPCGLGVRDILRLEMKYCLYGNDLLDDINPIHAGLKWIVDLSKKDFIGKKYLENELNNPTKRLLCFKMIDRAIPRKGYSVFCDNQKIGIVSSGTFSLGIAKGIG